MNGNSERALELPARSFGPALLWTIRILAAAALAISAYLSWISIRGGGAMGCGPSSGCAEVLNSRWSTWLGIPAGAIGALDYLAMLAATLFVGAGRPPSVRGRAWAVLAATAVAAAAAAIWFIFLQFEVLGDWCRYCLTVHCCGLVAAGLVFSRLPIVLTGTRSAVAGLVGLAAVCVLVFGQLLAPPKTYQIQTSRGPTPSTSPSVTQPAAGSGRHSPYGALITVGADIHDPVSHPGRQIELDSRKYPRIGAAGADHFIVMIGDYTCDHCRVTHRTLERLLPMYGGRVAVLVLPVPLDARCNPYVPAGHSGPAQACALARLALAVWCADPKAFPTLDKWLFAEDRSRLEDEARLYATDLIGADRLGQGERDPRVSQVLNDDIELYHLCNLGQIPKLLFGSTLVLGTVDDPKVLVAPIEREWGLKPGQP